MVQMCEEEIYNQTTIKQYAQRTLLNLQIDAKIRQICHFRHDKKPKLESFLKGSTRTSVIIQTHYPVEVKLVPLPQLNWFLILKRSCLGVAYPVWDFDSLYMTDQRNCNFYQTIQQKPRSNIYA